jgi:hypothetical protein
VAQAETSPNKSAFAVGGPSSMASEMPAANRLARRGSITRPSIGWFGSRTVRRMPIIGDSSGQSHAITG